MVVEKEGEEKRKKTLSEEKLEMFREEFFILFSDGGGVEGEKEKRKKERDRMCVQMGGEGGKGREGGE